MSRYINTSIVAALVTFSLCSFADGKTPSREELGEQNIERDKIFLASLPNPDQWAILRVIERMNYINKASFPWREQGTIQLFPEQIARADQPVILIVPGYPQFPGQEKYYEFYETLHYLRLNKYDTYFHSLMARKSVQWNAETIARSIVRLVKGNPGRRLIVLGHCTGGAVAIKSFQMINRDHPEVAEQAELVTMASPISGYGMPKFTSKPASWLMGGLVVDVAVGAFDAEEKFEPLRSNCIAFVTTNCQIDNHACKKEKTYPQLLTYRDVGDLTPEGAAEAGILNMPCGNNRVIFDHESTHHDIIIHAVKKLLPPL